MISRDKYVYYPALSASRIKRHYTGDLTRVAAALERGKSFHERLLDVTPAYMDTEASCVYKSIIGNKPWDMIWKDAHKEHAIIQSIAICDRVVPAKAMFDIYSPTYRIGADIKTTSVKGYEAFAVEMKRHYNHIQAVWFCKVAGIDPRGFVFIGIPPSARRGIVKPGDIIFYTFPDNLIKEAELLIENYIKTEWNVVQQYLNQRVAH